ncbi:zinc finger protein RFP-like, partial [Terrapene carolina triunguis]|uniref:zinc finger protein RFP-like n=1 Tax=Terrapene triunguis TaxID=2587831 RepID=UPI0011566FA2
MAATNPVESLQEEAKCPVCLEYFTEPVTLECGHNFCRACISQCWEGSDTAPSCPQCRETVQQRNLRPNRQLANVLEIAKRLSLQAAKGAGGDGVCERHQEALKLFCEEDQTPICVVCDRSRAHRTHMVVPIEEAAQEYKERIQAHL